MPQHDSAGERAVRAILLDAEEIRPRLQPLTVDEFLQLKTPPREMILGPWLPTKGLALVHGYRGGCKTLLGLGIAYAVAAGTEILGWRALRPRPVLFIDGEMPHEMMQERVGDIVAGCARQPPESDYGVSSRPI